MRSTADWIQTPFMDRMCHFVVYLVKKNSRPCTWGAETFRRRIGQPLNSKLRRGEGCKTGVRSAGRSERELEPETHHALGQVVGRCQARSAGERCRRREAVLQAEAQHFQVGIVVLDPACVQIHSGSGLNPFGRAPPERGYRQSVCVPGGIDVTRVEER